MLIHCRCCNNPKHLTAIILVPSARTFHTSLFVGFSTSLFGRIVARIGYNISQSKITTNKIHKHHAFRWSLSKKETISGPNPITELKRQPNIHTYVRKLLCLRVTCNRPSICRMCLSRVRISLGYFLDIDSSIRPCMHLQIIEQAKASSIYQIFHVKFRQS